VQITNSDGKILSSSFESAIAAPSQYVKPKVVVDFQDSRHLSNVVVSTNSDFSSQYPFSFSSFDGKVVNFSYTAGSNMLATDGYVSFPGVINNYAYVANSASLDIFGNIEIVMRLSMNQWVGSGVIQCLVSRFNNNGDLVFKIFNDVFDPIIIDCTVCSSTHDDIMRHTSINQSVAYIIEAFYIKSFPAQEMYVFD
jgi:hypothetical protein